MIVGVLKPEMPPFSLSMQTPNLSQNRFQAETFRRNLAAIIFKIGRQLAPVTGLRASSGVKPCHNIAILVSQICDRLFLVIGPYYHYKFLSRAHS